jgi:hypothetical protein
MTVLKFLRPKDLQALFARATSDAEKHEISWSGDIHQGHGAHMGFEGSYVVCENYITISVTKKPLWASKSLVEKEVAKYLSQ